ncbi:hypothetical protein ACLKA6_015934 [Drosophila palustris]
MLPERCVPQSGNHWPHASAYARRTVGETLWRETGEREAVGLELEMEMGSGACRAAPQPWAQSASSLLEAESSLRATSNYFGFGVLLAWL